MAEATRPPLTSVDMNLGALGREAGAALLEMIEDTRLPASGACLARCRERVLPRRART